VVFREDVQERLRLAYAQVVVNDVDPTESVTLACDLLVEGSDDEATVQLAIQSPGRLAAADAALLLARIVQRAGVEPPDPAGAARAVALDICRRIADGHLEPEAAAHRLLGAIAQSGHPSGVARLLPMLDRLEYDLGGRGDDAWLAGLLDLTRDVGAELAKPSWVLTAGGSLPRRRPAIPPGG